MVAFLVVHQKLGHVVDDFCDFASFQVRGPLVASDHVDDLLDGLRVTDLDHLAVVERCKCLEDWTENFCLDLGSAWTELGLQHFPCDTRQLLDQADVDEGLAQGGDFSAVVENLDHLHNVLDQVGVCAVGEVNEVGEKTEQLGVLGVVNYRHARVPLLSQGHPVEGLD